MDYGKYKSCGQQIKRCFKSKTGELYPFFWIRTGETDKIINELNQIYNSGIRAVCVEGRPYDEFGEESWWRDVGIILNECERFGMKVWILDDKSFPTGFAADYMKKNCPETKKWCIYSYCVDAVGPIKDGAVMLNHFVPHAYSMKFPTPKK